MCDHSLRHSSRHDGQARQGWFDRRLGYQIHVGTSDLPARDTCEDGFSMGASPVSNEQARRIAFMSGNDDFRAARLRCAIACQEYNKLPEDVAIEDRVKGWKCIVDPNNKTTRDADTTPAVDFSAIFKRPPKPNPPTSTAAHTVTPPVTPDSSSPPPPRPTIPYIKQPIYMDYGLRVKIAPTTFINRNCTILDTPVADIIIGEQCSLGPGVTIIGVGHPVRFEERCEFVTGKPGSWGAKVVIGDGVWVGAGVVVLPGVTIGSYSTIGAGSVVTKDVPPSCVAAGNPASVRYYVGSEKGREPVVVDEAANTLEDALKVDRED
ncbi:carbohydrate O-acetyltransferase [Diaporthe helianthi]|uniref:Carbohydrate O-acetyltransferase n=1 Tax=Diaporthe helianthi TaxID=158607 RepID=A0A2P5HQY3_DIAHE|nr:carbohydrate O-acetyltransferase [Diaporthe helianthi]